MPRIYSVSSYSLLLILIMISVSSCAGNKAAKTEAHALSWDTYLFNKERQGKTEDTMVPPPRYLGNFIISRVKAFVPYEPTQNSSPAIVDNIVYVGSSDKYFYAIDLIKSKELWRFSSPGAVESSPTVTNGKVYFGTSNGILYCLDSKSGQEIWKIQVKAEIISSPVVEDGIVYFNSADDKLYAVKAETGERLWQYSRSYVKRIVRRIFASPAVYGDAVYCTFADGSLVAIHKSSGNEVWKKSVGNQSGDWRGENKTIPSRFTPTIDNGLVYVIDENGSVIALDAKDGEERWRFDIIKAADFVINNDYLCIVGYDGDVIAMNRANGKIIWRRKVSKGIPVSAIIAGNYLIIASNYKSEGLITDTFGSYVDIFTVDKGKNVWGENIDSTTSTSPAVAYNHLLLITDKGHLRIYKSSP